MSTRTFTFNVTAAGNTYRSGMTPLSVRALSGAYAPTNGNGTTLRGMLPTEWQPPDNPPGSKYILYSWNGGVADNVAKRLYITGGGHSNGANNGVHVFDFSGDSAPVGWSTETGSLSALSAVRGSTSVNPYTDYTDGKPTAIHTYSQLAWDGVRNRFWRFGGSRYGDGAPTAASWYWDTVGKSWTQFSATGFGIGGGIILSPDSTQFLSISYEPAPRFVNIATGAQTVYNATLPWSWTGSQTDANPVFASFGDDTRYLCLSQRAFPQGSAGLSVVTVDWAAKTWQSAQVAATGSDAQYLGGGACLVYDANHSEGPCFWSFGSIPNVRYDAQIAYLLRIDATSYAVTRHNLLTPLSIIDSGNARGTFNRCIFFPDTRNIGFVYESTQPAVLIQLPS